MGGGIALSRKVDAGKVIGVGRGDVNKNPLEPETRSEEHKHELFV